YDMVAPAGVDCRSAARTIHFPAGALVLTSQYVVQRDPRWWPEPEKFIPERWAESTEGRSRFTYFPFGAVRGQCIGEAFAWMEGKLLLAAIAQHWKMQLMADPKVVPHPVITLRPKHGVGMRLQRR